MAKDRKKMGKASRNLKRRVVVPHHDRDIEPNDEDILNPTELHRRATEAADAAFEKFRRLIR